MYLLFQTYYRDVTEKLFLSDLSDKNYVLLFWDKKPTPEPLVGFSALYVRTETSRAITIFSGDTVLHERCWGSKILQKSFSKFIAVTKFRNTHRKVYWMLMSKGYKTYLLMRKNFPVSYPNYLGATPKQCLQVRNEFYHKRYGQAFDDKTSLIRFDEPHGAVKEEIAVPSPAAIQADPEIAYFIKANPNYLAGDELACIAEIRLRDIAYTMTKYVFGKKAAKNGKK